MNFWRDLQLDRLSFWVGFAAGFLFLLLLGRLRPALKGLLQFIKGRWAALRAAM